MTWAPAEAQKRIFLTLDGDSTLDGLIGAGRVFDHVPDNTDFPYVVIQMLPWDDRGNHTQEGWSGEFQITTWYQGPGRGNKGVQAIQARIDELLHKADISISGWVITGLRRTFVDIIPDADNVTLQGIQRYRLLLGEDVS